MLISKRHIRNVALYLADLPEDAPFHAVCSPGKSPHDGFARAGFADSPVVGDTILPRVIGPFTRFNARGRWLVRRDLPKEPRYIRTVRWRWAEYHGRDRVEHEGFKDIVRDCYARELRPPPSIELTVMICDGRLCVTSPQLTNTVAASDRNKHCINMMLELFGECEIDTDELREKRAPLTRRLNWRLLPPGEYPWEKLERHIDAAVGSRSDDTRAVIWDRQKTIKSFGPDEIFVGEAGFDDYLAYAFRRRGLVVLESVRKDNAIYVFGQDWKEVSQLSKADLLQCLHFRDIYVTR